MPDEATQESAQAAAEDKVADLIFGPEDEEYQPEPKPVVEGEESEEEEKQELTEEAKDDEDPDPIVEFEWNGQLIEAPTSIKESLMLQKDYTQKTQETAAERKTVEVQLGEVNQLKAQFEFAQSVQPDLLKAQQLEATADQAREYIRNNFDSLSQSDVMKWQMAIEDARTERDQLVQSITGKQGEFQQAQEQSHKELLNKGTEVLRSKIPGWGEEGQKQVRDYALSSGFTEAELNGVVDPRQVETLWKASQYDHLQSGKAAAVKTVQNAPSIKPKSRNPMPKDTQDRLNLRKKIKNPNRSPQDRAVDIGMDIANRMKI